jgi:elongator complex protein 2
LANIEEKYYIFSPSILPPLMSFFEIEYISIGGNRQSAAADCSSVSGLVAFGADINIALWQSHDPSQVGIQALLIGHLDKVTAVRFSTPGTQNVETLVSGSGDGEIRLWQAVTQDSRWECLSFAKAHSGAVNVVAFIAASATFATGGADGLIRLWRIEGGTIVPLHTISLKPRYIPLSLVLGRFPGEKLRDCMFLAVGGTKASVQVFVIEQLDNQTRHELQATLSGHEGWIRSLSLLALEDDFLLASASHDRYVRIWRIRNQYRKPEAEATNSEDTVEKPLTRKVQTLHVADSKYSIVFEALLLGHEDWVYSASWNPIKNIQQLLTASADGSLAIWEPDADSGIWISKSRLGEISGQKGATTATGSAGGFWVGLWSPDGKHIMCLDRSGSWRLWQHDQSSDYWTAKPGVSGHVGSANDIAWAKGGHYLLSTGSDQTSRLHAEWKGGQKRSWHEFARPQIHGYDLNCITAVSPQRFVSGADEKLLRVFDEPKNVSGMLHRLCGIEEGGRTDLPEAASMPVLGLSNKAADTQALQNGHDGGDAEPPEANPEILTIPLDGDEPPTEDLLARHTLWPEYEKLYGHGYEISEAASNDDGSILATACKASSTDHAVIRLYDTLDWHEIKPPLVAHSLTVTRLAFSCPPQRYLLSVGRDRQWTVFQQEANRPDKWTIYQAFPKAHSRMILDAAWSPISGNVFFATAGRDKVVKLWQIAKDRSRREFELVGTIPRRSAVTAISFTCDRDENLVCLVVGDEDGLISFHVFTVKDGLSLQKSWDREELSSAKAVTRVQWRPKLRDETSEAPARLAVAAADGSVRILTVRWVTAYLESAASQSQ